MFSYVYKFDLNDGLPKSVLNSLSYHKLKIKSALSLKRAFGFLNYITQNHKQS